MEFQATDGWSLFIGLITTSGSCLASTALPTLVTFPCFRCAMLCVMQASRRLRGSDVSGWSNPNIQTGNRIGMDSGGPTAQQQTAAVAIEQHVAAQDEGPAGASSTGTQPQDRLRSWLHPQLAHGKHMAFETGGAARQQEDTRDAIAADEDAISAGAGRKLLYTHHSHHTTHRYNQQPTEDIGATTAAEAETVDSVEQQAADIEEKATPGSRKLLGPQDWRHPQLAHGIWPLRLVALHASRRPQWMLLKQMLTALPALLAEGMSAAMLVLIWLPVMLIILSRHSMAADNAHWARTWAAAECCCVHCTYNNVYIIQPMRGSGTQSTLLIARLAGVLLVSFCCALAVLLVGCPSGRYQPFRE